MTKDEIISKLNSMAKHPTVTLPRDTEALRLAASLLEQSTEQEPVAWMNDEGDVVTDQKWAKDQHYTMPLYTHLPRPKEAAPRKPLMDDEIYVVAKNEGQKLALGKNPNIDIEFARAIIAAYEAKNQITGEKE